MEQRDPMGGTQNVLFKNKMQPFQDPMLFYEKAVPSVMLNYAHCVFAP